jgi:hypothetical protein
MTRVVKALLALHAVLAWLALQAVFVYVELMWRAVAGRDEVRTLLTTHLDQFRVLRHVQAALWVVTAAAFVRWMGHRVPYARWQMREVWNASNPRQRWWWTLLLATGTTDVTARGLASWSGGPLDLGPAMWALVIGQLLTAVAAVVGIAVVLGVDARQDAAVRPPPAARRAHENR